MCVLRTIASPSRHGRRGTERDGRARSFGFVEASSSNHGGYQSGAPSRLDYYFPPLIVQLDHRSRISESLTNFLPADVRCPRVEKKICRWREAGGSYGSRADMRRVRPLRGGRDLSP